MLLRKLSYEENSENANNWRIGDVHLSNITLIVGKNASGKSRLLNVIDNLAKLVSGRLQQNFNSGSWKCQFERRKNKALEYQSYSLSLKNRIIDEESFDIGGQRVMSRQSSGAGFVIKKSNKSRVQYKVPENQLMAVVRRDEYQHPHFDHLHKWGRDLRYYRFGHDLGQNNFLIIGPHDSAGGSQELALSNLVTNAAHVYWKTYERFKDAYKEAVLEDFRSIDFPCSDIKFGGAPISTLLFNGSPPMQLGVVEEDRKAPTYQNEMSQGMFRALAILIQMNANIFWTQSTKVGRKLELGDAPGIIIDDIGEGLDFSRARLLVGRLMARASEHNIQLIMSSNDRFIMNDVPLEHWVILHRKGQEVRALDAANSKDVFEKFDRLGLNNFDFFSNEAFLSDECN